MLHKLSPWQIKKILLLKQLLDLVAVILPMVLPVMQTDGRNLIVVYYKKWKLILVRELLNSHKFKIMKVSN